MDGPLIHVGTIGKPHGVGGHVHVHSHMENSKDLQRFGELVDDQGCCWFLTWLHKNVAVLYDADHKPVTHRDEAEKLVNRKLFVHKNHLPVLEKEEYYFNDLIGLTAKILTDKGKKNPLGKVVIIHDYGAGVSLEIKDLHDHSFLIPFTKKCVPTINIKEGYIIVILPNEVEVPYAVDGKSQ